MLKRHLWKKKKKNLTLDLKEEHSVFNEKPDVR